MKSEFEEDLKKLISTTQKQSEVFSALLIKTPGEEGILRTLFEVTAHLQVLADIQSEFNLATAKDKMPGIQMFLKRKACIASRENSMFGKMFSAQKRLYVAKLLNAWF